MGAVGETFFLGRGWWWWFLLGFGMWSSFSLASPITMNFTGFNWVGLE